MDPKAIPCNLSKRKQIVKNIIEPCSTQNKISIEEAIVILDQHRADKRQTVTQHWVDWKYHKKSKQDD